MKLKKGKVWRALWRQKSVTNYASSYEDDDLSRSSHSRSESRSSGGSFTSSAPSVAETSSMTSNYDMNHNGDMYGSHGKLTATSSVDRYDSNVLRKKRAHTDGSVESHAKSRHKSLPVEEGRSHHSKHKHKHSIEPSEDHGSQSRSRSSSKVSPAESPIDEIPRQHRRHDNRVHSIPEIHESQLTKSCEVSPVATIDKKDARLRKSHSVAAMSTVLETSTSAKSRDSDVTPVSRRISTSSRDSDDINIRKTSAISQKISNIEEQYDDENNNKDKSKKSKKKSKAPELRLPRPQTLDLNLSSNGDGGADEWEEEEEDDDIGVVTCSGHEHKKGHIYLDEVFNLSVDQIFQCIFTDSEFYRTFLSERKTYDIIQAPWPDDVDESGEKRREIGYTLSLNYSIGPKFTQSSEKQTILAQSKPGQLYVIVTDCTQSGIPYGENFYVQNRYCLMRVSSSKAKLIVQSEIKYRKNVWGLVKNLIEKNATLGMADNFKLMADFLRAEAEKTSPQGAGAGRKKMLRKRRPHASAPDRSPSLKRNTDPRGLHLTGGLQGQGAKGSVSEDEFHIKLSTDSLIYFVCAILLVLVLFNGFLFYKLWTLESKALSLHQFVHRRADHRHHDPLFTQPPRPHSTEEWNHIIDQQHRLHEMELERWKDVLTASVSLVDQMKITLQELLANIEHRTKLLADMVQQQREAPKH